MGSVRRASTSTILRHSRSRNGMRRLSAASLRFAMAARGQINHDILAKRRIQHTLAQRATRALRARFEIVSFQMSFLLVF